MVGQKKETRTGNGREVKQSEEHGDVRLEVENRQEKMGG